MSRKRILHDTTRKRWTAVVSGSTQFFSFKSEEKSDSTKKKKENAADLDLFESRLFAKQRMMGSQIDMMMIVVHGIICKCPAMTEKHMHESSCSVR
jgi:hypothetical protein